MVDITSPSNPIIKEIKSLYRKKGRWDKKLFIVEGVKMVKECIDNSYPLKYIIYSQDLFNIDGGKELFDSISSLQNLKCVPAKLFREISEMGTPQGILAIAKFRVNTMNDINKEDNPFLLLLDGVQDPGNMGTIIRTADAFGIDGVVITKGCVDVYNPKVVRATMGSIFRVPIYHEEDGIKLIKEFKKNKIKTYSTSLKGEKYIQNVDFKEGGLLIIGNESKGVSETLESIADDLIKIPMAGGAESLNVAVASSIIMYEVMRQRIQ
ncbi:MAG: RNA methyltransferase [Tissierellia bacterium]|nr:RNA methyltransferase [Tissierellia bacterium]